jgi:hypothetical protein
MAFTPNKLIYYGFAAIGAGYVWKLVRGEDDAPQAMVPAANGSGRNLGRAPTGSAQPLVMKDGVRSITFHPAGDIKQRVGYIVDQIRKDAETKEVVTEARALLSRKCPVDPRSGMKGLQWCIEPKAWKKEQIALFFHALTDPNSRMALRYTRDPYHYDAFGSSALMRRLPAADCDEMVIRLGALLSAVGYRVKCRVVAPAGQPGQWAHIYLIAADEPGTPNPAKWYSLDPTEPQHGPFWEVPKHLVSSVRDFDV